MRRKTTENMDAYENFCYRRRWKRITSVLAVFVVIGTLSALMLPAITMSDPQCGLSEHTHTEQCWVDGQAEPVCGLTEHTHTDQCMAAPELTEAEQAQIAAVTAALAALPDAGQVAEELEKLAADSDRDAWDRRYAEVEEAAGDARAGLDGMPENLRSMVEGTVALTELEAVLASAVPPMTEEEKQQQQVADVVALIDELPAREEVEALISGTEDPTMSQELTAAKNRIQAALDAYGALSAEQQQQVNNGAELLELEAVLATAEENGELPAETEPAYQPVLPDTGGSGTGLYRLSGLLLTGLSLTALADIRRRKPTQKK